MDLPPGNSFCRMLAHKLADYYHMTHSFDSGFVRIFRTPFCRVPPPLSSINTSTSSTPPPAVLPRKIMRRGEDGELAPVSAGPSKPTSEVGSDAKDKAPPVVYVSRLPCPYPSVGRVSADIPTGYQERKRRKRTTRRESGSSGTLVRPRHQPLVCLGKPRIEYQTTDPLAENGDGVGLSRESSVSAKDKSNLGKKGKNGRKRTDDTEWDSRNKYQPFYGHPQQATWVSPQYIPVGSPQFSGQLPQQSYQTPMPATYNAPAQPYQPMLQNNAYPQQVNNMHAVSSTMPLQPTHAHPM